MAEKPTLAAAAAQRDAISCNQRDFISRRIHLRADKKLA